MEAKVIRGYKLKLWKDRLNLAPSFVEMVDNMGLNYVTLEVQEGEDSIQIVLLTKIKGSHQPMSVLVKMSNEIADALVERIEI